MPLVVKQQQFSSYNLASFMGTTATVGLDAGQFVVLGSIQMGSRQGVYNGYGSNAGQDSAVGRMWWSLKDGSTPAVQLSGFLRLDVVDSNDNVVATLWTVRTEDVLTSETDRRQMFPFPQVGSMVGPDYSLVLKFKADTLTGNNGTVALANSGGLMNVTAVTLVEG